MHCKSCEMLIEDNLKEKCQIEKCEVSHTEKSATIFYDGTEPDRKKIEATIREAGYEVGSDEKKTFFSKNANDYKDLLIGFLALVILAAVLKTLGINNLNVSSAESPSSLPVVLLIGLTAGISTCMALVGGLVLSMSVKYAAKHPESSTLQKFKPHIAFNLGRIIGYGILGGILGLAGSALQISSTVNGILVILVGAVMLVLGFQLINIFLWLNDFNIALPKSISRALGIKENNEYSHAKTFILGTLTFFVPCGFTQAMQVYALSSGSFLGGALIMSTFALGTAPGLLGIGGITSLVKGIFAKRFFKFAGLVVIFLSFFNIANGMKLLGYEIDWSSDNVPSKTIASQDPNVTIVNGVQVVRMTENGEGYSPNRFTIRKDIPVRWVIDAQAPNSCASALVIPKLDIRKFLKSGENIIEFTPTEIGKLSFSCSMGMYTGSFNVVDKNDSSSANAINAANASEEDSSAPAHTCGAASGSGTCGATCGGSCGCGKK